MRLSRSIVFVVLVCCGGAVFAQDTDGDGWTAADGDCCDRVEDGCPVPAKVNPGAYDVTGNGFDDDCDGVIDNPPPDACSTSPRFASLSGLLLAQAMDLCQTAAAAPPLSERRWGLISAELLRADGSAPGPADIQTAVFGDFGVNAPRLNATMAGISSGTARDLGDPGYRDPELATSYQSGTAAVSAPARLLQAHGGSLITLPGCPEAGPLVHDSVLLRLRIRVPTNAAGFAFDHRFFTAEWPEVCTDFNDHLVALLDSQVAGLPADGNILFDASNNPVTVQTVFYEVCSGCTGGNAELSGTGYGPTTGGGTGWHTAGAPVVPGEEIVLDIHIWDATDGFTDSLALLDAFRWILDTPEPPAMTLSVRDIADPVILGNPIEYEIQVASNIAVPGPGVVITIELPEGVTATSAASTQGDCSGSGTGTVTCDLGPMSAEATVTVRAMPSVAGRVVNLVTMTPDALVGPLSEEEITTVLSAGSTEGDADGWAVADGDCCERVEDGCPVPAKVNPGAYDVAGNGFDDDCDGVIDNPPPDACSTSPRFASLSGLVLAQAMDLCQTTAAAPPLPERRWGLIDATLLRADGSSPGPADIQTAVFGNFGVNVPRLNATMAGISSGTARDASDPGYRNPELATSYQSGTAAVSAPARLLQAHGGSLITLPGCPEAGPLVHDSVLLRLRIRVPTNAAGFVFDHRFFTAEWPEVCTDFNDHLVALLDSQVAGLPADGNILFDASNSPVTVQTVFYEVCAGCVEGNAELSGSGYGPTTGGGTGSLTAGAPVVPGEEILLDIHIWDATDGFTDSLALLDAFRWIGVLNDDSDGDGVFDLYDCAPAQAGTWLAPSAARSLSVSGGPAGLTLEWQPPLEPGGTEIAYDILRSANPADFTDATCLVTATPATSAGIVPDAGNEFYLVRSRNTCGGTLGSDSSGTERTGPFCP